MAVPVSFASTRKGNKLFKEADKALAAKDFDQAVQLYDAALATDPNDASYLLADRRAHTQAGEFHIRTGRQLQTAQKLDEALVEFNKAFLADPSSQVAAQEIRETTQMIKERSQVPTGTPVLTPAEKSRQEMEQRLNSLEAPPELRSINDEIRSLKMNNQPARVLFESVAKLAGINVLFDSTGFETTPGKTYNLDLTNVTLEEALNYVALETHTFWKAISHNAIFVTQENEQKRAEYQDEVVKVFYIQNATTQAEFTEIFNAVRVGAKVNVGLFQVASQNAIVARGTVDTIDVIEKLIHDLDKPKAEVVMDVLVLEVNKSTVRTLGASILGAGGLNLPVTFAPRSGITTGTTSTTGTTTTGTTTTGTTGTTTGTTSVTGISGTGTTGSTGTTTTTTGSTGIPLNNLGRLSTADWSTTMPSALLQALLTSSSARIVQRPQIRATDNGKASIKIGEKIPYVSGSLNSAVATPGSIPYATTQFQQVDVGVNIDFQPHVNGPNDVSMHVKVEISNTPGDKSVGGIDEPIIAQRVNEADVRMRDGEVSLLGGLSDLEDSTTANGFPGLTNIPALGYLFGSKTRNKTDDQILIALVPHIVRRPDMSDVADPGIYAGSERVVRVRHKPDGSNSSLAPTDGARSGGSTPTQPSSPVQPVPNPFRAEPANPGGAPSPLPPAQNQLPTHPEPQQ